MTGAEGLNDDPAPPSTFRTPSTEICCRLADNLRRYRYYRGFTQRGLADACGLHKNYVSNVEMATVNITLASLEALATGLRCGEDELLRRQLLLPPFR